MLPELIGEVISLPDVELGEDDKAETGKSETPNSSGVSQQKWEGLQ
jgi:hypothetical protein